MSTFACWKKFDSLKLTARPWKKWWLGDDPASFWVSCEEPPPPEEVETLFAAWTLGVYVTCPWFSRYRRILCSNYVCIELYSCIYIVINYLWITPCVFTYSYCWVEKNSKILCARCDFLEIVWNCGIQLLLVNFCSISVFFQQLITHFIHIESLQHQAACLESYTTEARMVQLTCRGVTHRAKFWVTWHDFWAFFFSFFGAVFLRGNRVTYQIKENIFNVKSTHMLFDTILYIHRYI